MAVHGQAQSRLPGEGSRNQRAGKKPLRMHSATPTPAPAGAMGSTAPRPARRGTFHKSSTPSSSSSTARTASKHSRRVASELNGQQEDGAESDGVESTGSHNEEYDESSDSTDSPARLVRKSKLPKQKPLRTPKDVKEENELFNRTKEPARQPHGQKKKSRSPQGIQERPEQDPDDFAVQ